MTPERIVARHLVHREWRTPQVARFLDFLNRVSGAAVARAL